MAGQQAPDVLSHLHFLLEIFLQIQLFSVVVVLVQSFKHAQIFGKQLHFNPNLQLLFILASVGVLLMLAWLIIGGAIHFVRIGLY